MVRPGRRGSSTGAAEGRRRRAGAIGGWLVLFAAISGASGGAEEPGSSGGDPPKTDALSSTRATCRDLRISTENLDGEGPERVDLSVAGELTLVQSDGALVYLGLCAPPDPQVLCVAYSANGMKEGEMVIASGNYRRPDADHVLLDPCLASYPR